ncbi:MAG: DNA repair protein RecN [Desulfobacula sp.]|nr:DNA repair protein RecN [Desulfobacula sp.]
MLSELAIKKFAIIDDIRILFKPGLSVLTGETGAGKSIIIEAVNLLLGSRASADLVRTGEETAELEAFFDIEPDSHAAKVLGEQGMDGSEGLIIRRVISSSGKSRVFVNSRQTTLDFLKQVTWNLAGISSQHAYQGLLREENHLYILDEFADTIPMREEVTKLYKVILPLAAEIDILTTRKKEKIREQDLLQFQVDEIEAAVILPEEDEDLEIQRERLQNASKIFEAVNGSIHEIYDRERSLIERISLVKTDVEKFSQADNTLEAVTGRLESMVFELQDVAQVLRTYSATIDLDPESLELVNQRLDLISRLKRKYGGSLSSLFDQYEAMRTDLAGTQGLEKQIQSLVKEKAGLEQEIRQKVKALSMVRQKAGILLADLAQKELGALEMGKARFEVAFSSQVDSLDKDSGSDKGRDSTQVSEVNRGPGNSKGIYTEDRQKIFPTGMDKIRFLLSPNPGELPRPLAKIASGGELSRIVLALKAVLSFTQSLETLIFDEVDAGIGGATSEKVGLKLKELGGRHQVICITHLAQIAKYGANQFRISKELVNGRTCTSIIPLETQEERVEEIARMIGGQKITPATLAHAKELLARP